MKSQSVDQKLSWKTPITYYFYYIQQQHKKPQPAPFQKHSIQKLSLTWRDLYLSLLKELYGISRTVPNVFLLELFVLCLRVVHSFCQGHIFDLEKYNTVLLCNLLPNHPFAYIRNTAPVISNDFFCLRSSDGACCIFALWKQLQKVKSCSNCYCNNNKKKTCLNVWLFFHVNSISVTFGYNNWVEWNIP